ncbi:MAG: DUF411 domain-containing protein [Hyphomicrobium sp.]
MAAAVILSFTGLPAKGHAADAGRVWKSPTCGCCKAWVTHMQSKGFPLEVSEVSTAELNTIKTTNGVTGKYASCHTAKISGYVIEGHVPAEAVSRLIAEKPDALGLAVPGMPAGSPGMETDGPGDPYDVVLIKKDGTSEIFAHYPAAPAKP